MMCLRSETQEVSVSAVTTENNRRGNCRACPKETGYNRAAQAPHRLCLGHKDTNGNYFQLKCNVPGCDNPQGNHNEAAHTMFSRGSKRYRATPPRQEWWRQRRRSDEGQFWVQTVAQASTVTIQVFETEWTEKSGRLEGQSRSSSIVGGA